MANKPLLFLDFETRSDVNIKKAGGYRYVNGIHFAPLCMAYAIDDNPEVYLWTPDKPFPMEILRRSTLLPFNVEFEYNVLTSRWFRWHDIDLSWLKHEHFIDVQALARTFGFPAKLEKLVKALGVQHKKDTSGTRLINALCVIKNNKIPTPETHADKFLDLYDYCRQDVRATRDCFNMLVKKDLTPLENRVFIHMQEQNEAGLPIDVESVKAVRVVLGAYVEHCNGQLSKLTNGMITKGTQVQKITAYIKLKFPSVDSIAAPIIKEILDNNLLDTECREILKLRQQVSHSSNAKYTRMMDMLMSDDRIRGNLKYYGGHTGRFAGVGFQMHNLPRAKHDKPEDVLYDFKSMPLFKLMDKYGNLGKAASKLVRPMIKAPEGMLLCVADYVSIENVMLHWVAGDTQTVDDFANKLDQYKTYAARRFNVHYSEVSKKQRTYAKPCVLGLGYGGGAGALQRVAANYGVELSDRAAEKDKKFYRATFPMIPELWYKVSDYMIHTVKTGLTVQINTGTVTIQFVKRGTYAFIILPSGRFLSYPAPMIQRDAKYDRECFTYMGEDPYTKQWRRLGDQNRKVMGVLTPDMPIHGGRLVENIIQALARDILVFGMLQAREVGFNIIGSVHDEAIAEVHETATSSSLDWFCEVLCLLPDWAKGAPVRAEGYMDKRYRKD